MGRAGVSSGAKVSRLHAYVVIDRLRLLKMTTITADSMCGRLACSLSNSTGEGRGEGDTLEPIPLTRQKMRCYSSPVLSPLYSFFYPAGFAPERRAFTQ